MSSYKGHSIFALILSLLMFYDPFAIALAILGANIPDFDHELKRNHVLIIISVGILLSMFLYLLNLPIYLGLIIGLLGVIFLLSSHRGFTHSILGCIVLAVSLFLLVYFGMDLSSYFNLSAITNIPLNYIILAGVLIFLSILFLNRKLASIFIVFMVLFIGLVSFGIIPVFKINVYVLIFSIFLGLFSHMILDSFSPSGIKPFSPFSDKKYYKKLGIFLLAVIIVSYLLLFPDKLAFYFNFLSNIN
ncbi:MAG: metal-dependent hydrolase [Methanobrevibacter sp.]|nr:metal-dependent hydrolase [Methanobrevibacter sp.]